MSESLLAEAIRNMGAEELLRAFENPRWGGAARRLLRAELIARLAVVHPGEVMRASEVRRVVTPRRV